VSATWDEMAITQQFIFSRQKNTPVFEPGLEFIGCKHGAVKGQDKVRKPKEMLG
jgi:hypothetical protein